MKEHQKAFVQARKINTNFNIKNRDEIAIDDNSLGLNDEFNNDEIIDINANYSYIRNFLKDDIEQKQENDPWEN